MSVGKVNEELSKYRAWLMAHKDRIPERDVRTRVTILDIMQHYLDAGDIESFVNYTQAASVAQPVDVESILEVVYENLGIHWWDEFEALLRS